MPFLGTIVNTVAVVVGSLIGMGLKRGLSKSMEAVLTQALSLCVVFIGVAGTMQYMLTATEADGVIGLSTQGTMLLIGSLAVGSLVGQLIDIEGALERLADWVRRKFAKDGSDSRFTEGFVTSTLVICVGAMAIVGSINDGMGQPETLFAKAALDFIFVLVLSSTLGIGVAFSAAPLFIYQSIFCLIGLLAGSIMPQAMINDLSMVGNVLIFAIGVNLMLRSLDSQAHIKVGNMLPALLIPILYDLVLVAMGRL